MASLVSKAYVFEQFLSLKLRKGAIFAYFVLLTQKITNNHGFEIMFEKIIKGLENIIADENGSSAVGVCKAGHIIADGIAGVIAKAIANSYYAVKDKTDKYLSGDISPRSLWALTGTGIAAIFTATIIGTYVILGNFGSPKAVPEPTVKIAEYNRERFLANAEWIEKHLDKENIKRKAEEKRVAKSNIKINYSSESMRRQYKIPQPEVIANLLAPYYPMITEISKHYGIDDVKLAATPVVESTVNPNAVGKSGDRGLCQIIRGTEKILVPKITDTSSEYYYPGFEEKYNAIKSQGKDPAFDPELNLIMAAVYIKMGEEEIGSNALSDKNVKKSYKFYNSGNENSNKLSVGKKATRYVVAYYAVKKAKQIMNRPMLIASNKSF